MKHLLFAFRCRSSTDDADDVFISLGEDDHDNASNDRSDSDEAVFMVGMGSVKDLKVVNIRTEKFLRFSKRDAVFGLIGEVLLLIPFEVHTPSVLPLVAKSMAYTARLCWLIRRSAAE